MYTLSPEELAARGVSALPSSLGEAVAALAADPLAREVLGPAMHDAFVAQKTAEWESYCAHVSDWELQRYLEFF
jgi:glutamine synthetase